MNPEVYCLVAPTLSHKRSVKLSWVRNSVSIKEDPNTWSITLDDSLLASIN
jgi:hypothetical protein